jgi:hypothetical protein
MEALGAERLTSILLAIADEQPAIKRRLRMELAAQVGVLDLAAEVERHLDAMAAARGRVNWRKLKGLRQDLDLLRSMITERVAHTEPATAVRLLLRFLRLEHGVLARVKDTKGEIAEVFLTTLDDLSAVATKATDLGPDFADVAFAALADVRAGAMGEMSRALAPAFTADAVARLRALIETEMALRRRVNAGWREALQALLDRQGDAEAYAATYSASEVVLPPVGANIARRFLSAGQLDAAERALEKSNPKAGSIAGRALESDPGLQAWESVRIDVLQAKGYEAAAQTARWAMFERTLSADFLRAHLRRLSGFDDVIAMDRAVDHAKRFKPLTRALAFFIAWPNAAEASSLVLARTGEIDGLAIQIIEPAVRVLEGRYPLAATLLLRAMIRDVARFAQAEHYPRARAWLAEAAQLAAQIGDFNGHEDHAEFEARLR